MQRKILKRFIIIICIAIVFITLGIVSVYAGESRTWCFDDTKFSCYSDMLDYPTTIDGLTFSKGTKILRSLKLFKGTKFEKYLYLDRSTDINLYSASFNLNGSSDIYIIGRSEGGDAAYRKLRFRFSNSAEDKFLSLGPATGYKLEYRGGATKVTLNAIEDDVRIYTIAVVDYIESEHKTLEEGTSYSWDFSNLQGETYTTNVDINGLEVHATAEKPVVPYVGETTDSGYRYYQGLDLKGQGSRFYRAVSFEVPKNSDIYITARSSNTPRNLYVTNEYECDITDYDGKLVDSKFSVGTSTTTYRIRYRGNGEKIYLKSEDGGIRLYKIEVAGPSYNEDNDYKWIFDDYNELQVNRFLGNYTVAGLNISSNTTRPASVVASSSTEFSKAIRITSSHFQAASKISFNVSDSSNKESGKRTSNRIIRVKAKGTDTGTRLILGNQYGYVYGCYSLSKEIKEYVFNYDGSYEKLYLFTNAINSSHNTTEIYSISTSDISRGDPVSIRIYCNNGNKIKYNFTVENMINPNDYYYTIKYDSSKISLMNIGKDYNNSNVIIDDNVQVISNVPGEIKFTIANINENDWSGIVTFAVFNAVASGYSNIEFIAERK